MRLSDFDFSLPEKLIAQYPPADRSAGRLLDCVRADLADRLVRDLPLLLEAGDVLVFNDTKVIKARLSARKETGGAIEVMVERMIGEHQALAMIKASHAPKIGSRLVIEDGISFTVLDRVDMLYKIECTSTIDDVLARFGALPLPPYIEHAPDANDEIRYQTVYASNPGAVAAPTAGLHFDEDLLGALDARGIERVHLTLHVGAGTFLPVREDDLSRHVMHSEYFSIPPAVRSAIAKARSAKRRVVAVGTTSLRALEAASDGHGNVNPGAAQTEIFITPGYRFNVVDMLFTNFHLPKSTLLMLVSAFAGTEAIRRAYSHAIASGYRFFSYGDAMLLERS